MSFQARLRYFAAQCSRSVHSKYRENEQVPALLSHIQKIDVKDAKHSSTVKNAKMNKYVPKRGSFDHLNLMTRLSDDVKELKF